MRFYFIRHAQSVNNALWDVDHYSKQRNEDPELTEIGRQQARMLASYIQRMDAEAGDRPLKRDAFGFTHVYCSLMVRAVETDLAVSEAAKVPLVAWPEIHETGGIFLDDEETGSQNGLPGKPRSYFINTYRGLALPETVTEEGWWNRPFEPDEARPLRAKHVYQELLARHGGTHDRVAIVSHGGFYMHLMREIFTIEGGNIWFQMHNTAITRVDFRPSGEAVLIYHNRTEHLPESLLT